MILSLTAGMRKVGKSWDLIRKGEGVEKHGGGGSRGRLHSSRDDSNETASNTGSHGGGGSSREVNELGACRGASAALLSAGGCSNAKRTRGICFESGDMSAYTTL